MYLKCHRRLKDGKQHRYWSIVEKCRCAGGRIVDRHVIYLGEINDSQRQSWMRSIEAFNDSSDRTQELALFPDDTPLPDHAAEIGVQICLSEFRLHKPRQWGACWVFMHLWEMLQLDGFWQKRLRPSREGTQWYHVFVTLCAYRWIDPGSEWRLHRIWFNQSAMGDLLGEDFSLVAKDNLYRCLDKLLDHKQALFSHLRQRWTDMFNATFDILLYDLTSTYFECDPPEDPNDKRRFGYSRDKRSDCVQVVIALVVTPEGFPLAYEVLSGNTQDKSTLKEFLQHIEAQYGKARRIWVMDRGIPTEETLEIMRKSDPPTQYLVGTPKGRLSKFESQLLEHQWQHARPSVKVKLLPNQEEVYVYVESQSRVYKERSMRRRKLKKLWKRLKEIQSQKPTYETLLMKLGAEKKDAGRIAWSLVDIQLPPPTAKGRVTFTFHLRKKILKQVVRREGRYLLRSNLTETDPSKLWEQYVKLTEVEEAFKNLKGDLGIRPVFHQVVSRIEAHIFVCFMAYCVQVTLKALLKGKAPGLTPKQIRDKFAGIQMLDVHFPTTDGRELVFTRYTQPEKDHLILLSQLGWKLPQQPKPRISAKREVEM